MVVGIIDHATGTRDIRRLAWLGQRSRPLFVIAARRDREHGRAAAVPRLRRQGGRLRNRSRTARHSARRRPTCSRASCSGRCSPPSTACGSCGVRSAARDYRGPSTRVAEMHPPHGHASCPRRRILAAAGLVFGLWPAAAGRRARRPTPTPCPAERTTTSRCGTGSALPLLLSVVVLAVRHGGVLRPGPAAPGREPARAAARQRRPHLRRGRCAAWTSSSAAAHRVPPSAVRFRPPSR